MNPSDNAPTPPYESHPSHECSDHSEGSVAPIIDHEQLRWKPLMVAALTATETALDGLPIPAAKGCISLVRKVIEATDIAAENQEILKHLQERYGDLLDFLRSLAMTDIPSTVRQDVDALDKKLNKLAKRWEVSLTKPRKRGYFMKLLLAHSERDMLTEFLNKTNHAITDFLLRVEVKSCILNYREIIKSRHAAVISSMPHAQFASYNSLRADRAGLCLAGTRQTVLKAIDEWALNPDPGQPPIFWLNGLAGIGKTTIAHTIATSVDEKGQLGASFFFLRSDDQRNDARLVFPTLALQLSAIHPLVRTRLAEVLENDPGCVNQSLEAQFDKLILTPMSVISLSKPLIFVLDAIDECQPNIFTANILQVLISNLEKIPFLRIFITSRPEAHIRESLGIVGSESIYRKLVLHENIEVQQEVEEDIRLYLKTSLQHIWNRDKSGEWPSAADLETLVYQSGKLFIYAATAVRFIGGNRSLNVDRQLRNLLKVQKKHVPNSDVEPYLNLDHLYLAILGTSFAIIDTQDIYYNVRFQHIVGSMVLMQQALPMESLATFLGDYDVDEIQSTLYYLHSIFIVPNDPSQALQTYHLSFPNFITNAKRCTNPDAYIDPQKQERYLFLRCLDTMKHRYGPIVESTRRLEIRHALIDSADRRHSPGDLGEKNDSQSNVIIALSEEVSNISNDLAFERDSHSSNDPYKGDTLIPPEVRYSNNHWCSHLVNIRVKSASTRQEDSKGVEKSESELPSEVLEQLVSALEQFINNYLSHWLDWRVDCTSLTSGAERLKLAQDTFDIMNNAYRWIAVNIDSKRSRSLNEVLKKSARTAFYYLFPQATGDYTLGNRLIQHVTDADPQFVPRWDPDLWDSDSASSFSARSFFVESEVHPWDLYPQMPVSR